MCLVFDDLVCLLFLIAVAVVLFVPRNIEKEKEQMNLKPTPGRILIEINTEDVQTPSGLILPSTRYSRYNMAKVVKVGGARRNDPIPCAAGDNILCELFDASTSFRINDKCYSFISFGDVVAVEE